MSIFVKFSTADSVPSLLMSCRGCRARPDPESRLPSTQPAAASELRKSIDSDILPRLLKMTSFSQHLYWTRSAWEGERLRNSPRDVAIPRTSWNRSLHCCRFAPLFSPFLSKRVEYPPANIGTSSKISISVKKVVSKSEPCFCTLPELICPRISKRKTTVVRFQGRLCPILK